MFRMTNLLSTSAMALETVHKVAPEFSGKKFRIIRHANPGATKKVDEVHLATNLKIRECLEDSSLGTCMHITGRMNAMTDPFHSDLCTNIFRKTEIPFIFSYLDLGKPDRIPIDIVKQKKLMWPHVDWLTSLSALKKEAQSQIQSYSVRQSSPVQFTVFGNRYVQLQSCHDDEGPGPVAKHVWLIESEGMHDVLLEHASSVISHASLVPANLFREAYDLILGFAARLVLKKLADADNTRFECAVLEASDFHEKPKQVLRALIEFDFVERGMSGQVTLTQQGRDLLETLNVN